LGSPYGSSWEDAPTLRTFSLCRILVLLPFFPYSKQGDDDEPDLPRSCVSRRDAFAAVAAPPSITAGSACYFYLQLPSMGEVGEIPPGQPQRFLFVWPLLPVNRGKQKQERQFNSEENLLSTILDFISPLLQTMPLICNLQSTLQPPLNPQRVSKRRPQASPRFEGGKEPEEISTSSGAAIFYSFPPPPAACSAGCILHNRTKPHHGSSPSLRRTPERCQLSSGMTEMKQQGRRGDIFLRGGRKIRRI